MNLLKPTVIVDEAQQPLATIKNGDAVICFNFRTDRCREITASINAKRISRATNASFKIILYNYDRV